MCKAVSWWYVRSSGVGKLLISEKTDSHTEAATEFGIRDNGRGGEVCAGEFWPDPAKPNPDPATWVLHWDYADHSRRPDWMDDETEASLRRALERAAKRYIFSSGNHKTDAIRAFVFGTANLTIVGGGVAYCYDSSRVVARGSSRVEAFGSSSVEALEDSRVVARDSSRVEAQSYSWVMALGSSSVDARDWSRVEALGSSRVEARDSSSVVARESSRVEAFSKYADVAGRAAWDGDGYPVCRATIEVGKTYSVVAGELKVVDVPV